MAGLVIKVVGFKTETKTLNLGDEATKTNSKWAVIGCVEKYHRILQI